MQDMTEPVACILCEATKGTFILNDDGEWTCLKRLPRMGQRRARERVRPNDNDTNK